MSRFLINTSFKTMKTPTSTPMLWTEMTDNHSETVNGGCYYYEYKKDYKKEYKKEEKEKECYYEKPKYESYCCYTPKCYY